MNYKSILYLDAEDSSYTRGIKSELQKISKKVDCYLYSDIYIWPIFCYKLHNKKGNQQKETNIRQLLDHIKYNKYDIILVKAPDSLPTFFFERLRTIFNNVPIINYNWHSIKDSSFLPYCQYFSKVYSFDRVDCQKHNLNYYPIFYLKDFENVGINSKKVFKFSHIGSAFNSGRLDFVNSAAEKFKFMNLKYFFYLYAPGKRKGLVTRLKYPSLSECLFANELSLNEVINKFSESEAMIDHPMLIQSGLTIRTFETLGSGLILYTTNVEIMKEPFFNPHRIKIIDKKFNNFTFEEKEFGNPDMEWQASFTQYRIDNWIKHIMNI